MITSQKKTSTLKRENKMEFVCQRVLSQLSGGDYGGGEKLPPERLLAKQHQVSYTTIRRAIKELTDQGYLVRKVGKGTFVRPEIIGKKLHRRLGLLWPAWQSPEVMTFTTYISKIAETNNWKIRVFTYRGLDDRQIHEAVHSCDALIVLPIGGVFPPDVVELFRNSSTPTVFIGLPTYGMGLNSVIGEPETDVDLAMDHLEQLGHERIAFAFHDFHEDPSSGAPGPRQFDRWKFRITKKLGKEAVDDLAIIASDIPPFEWPYQAFADRISQIHRQRGRLPFTAIIGHISIFWAQMSTLCNLGYKIPDDISLVAIGERKEAEFFYPRPTSVYVNIEEHMIMAWDIIMQKIENPGLSAKNAIVNPHLIVGQTSGSVKRSVAGTVL